MVRLWTQKVWVNLLRINCVSLTSSHTRRFGLTVSFRRKLLTLRQLSHGQNICFYFADASARTSSDTASTWCVCGTQKIWVNLLWIIFVLPTSLHTRQFGLTVSFRRSPSSFYESYRMGRSSTSTSLMPQLVQAVILPQHDASAEKDQPAALSSVHNPTLDRVWYHAP